MALSEEHASGAGRVRRYRQRLRDQRMRPLQLWVADVRAPGFAAEAHRQSAAVAAGDQAFIDALSLDDA